MYTHLLKLLQNVSAVVCKPVWPITRIVMEILLRVVRRRLSIVIIELKPSKSVLLLRLPVDGCCSSNGWNAIAIAGSMRISEAVACSGSCGHHFLRVCVRVGRDGRQ